VVEVIRRLLAGYLALIGSLLELGRLIAEGVESDGFDQHADEAMHVANCEDPTCCYFKEPDTFDDLTVWDSIWLYKHGVET